MRGVVSSFAVALWAVGVAGCGGATSAQASLFGGDPYTVEVQIVGEGPVAATSVEGLEVEVEVVQYDDGGVLRKRPGRVKYGDITLKRGYAGVDDALLAWVREVSRGKDIRKNITVTLHRTGDKPTRTFNLVDCFPTRWSLPRLSADGTAPLGEEIVISAQLYEER